MKKLSNGKKAKLNGKKDQVTTQAATQRAYDAIETWFSMGSNACEAAWPPKGPVKSPFEASSLEHHWWTRGYSSSARLLRAVTAEVIGKALTGGLEIGIRSDSSSTADPTSTSAAAPASAPAPTPPPIRPHRDPSKPRAKLTYDEVTYLSTYEVADCPACPDCKIGPLAEGPPDDSGNGVNMMCLNGGCGSQFNDMGHQGGWERLTLPRPLAQA